MKQTWKEHERRTARRLGGERVPVADKRSDTDVLHPWLSIECKHRKSLPKWLHKAMQQATDADPSKTPIAVLHELNKNSDNDYVVVRLLDFEKLIAAYQDIEYLKVTMPDFYQDTFAVDSTSNS